MFGSKRRKATAAAQQVVDQVLRTASLYRTVTPDFWRDPFVLGIVYGLAGTVSRQAVGRMPAEDEGRVVMEVIANASGDPSTARTTLGFIQAQDQTFIQAAQRASHIAVMMVTRAIDEMSPDIERAIEQARVMRRTNAALGIQQPEIAEVITALSEIWIIDPLRSRMKEE